MKIYGVLFLFAVILLYPILLFIVYQVSKAWTAKAEPVSNNIRSTQPWQRIILANNTKEESPGGEYPTEIFSTEDLGKGAIVLHIFGICYMFLALSVICDEFFVPALHVLSEILAISDDVAGATFMAAGGSAPELFTSILGVFVAKTNIGFGTIVGSAVFNVLFVIGMCVIFSKSILHLTWWPLLRDSIFYAFSLIILITCFSDGQIKWWESLSMFAIYICYVLFMYFNETTEKKVKSFIAGLARKDSKVTPMVSVDQTFMGLYVISPPPPVRSAFLNISIHIYHICTCVRMCRYDISMIDNAVCFQQDYLQNYILHKIITAFMTLS